MADKVYFGDDADRFAELGTSTVIQNFDDVQRLVKTLHVYAEAENRGAFALVKVHKNTGTGEFFARGGGDLDTLRKLAGPNGIVNKGSIDVYKITYSK